MCLFVPTVVDYTVSRHYLHSASREQARVARHGQDKRAPVSHHSRHPQCSRDHARTQTQGGSLARTLLRHRPPRPPPLHTTVVDAVDVYLRRPGGYARLAWIHPSLALSNQRVSPNKLSGLYISGVEPTAGAVPCGAVPCLIRNGLSLLNGGADKLNLQQDGCLLACLPWLRPGPGRPHTQYNTLCVQYS